MSSKTLASDPPGPHPAPGRLRWVQELVNTRELETGNDELTSPAALSTWLAYRALLPRGTVLDEAALQKAVEIREGLRAMIRTHTGGELAEGTVERLRKAFGECR